MTTSDFSTSGVRVSLTNVDLWQEFYPRTEMVVTNPGRKLFPNLEVTIGGLDPDALYTVHLYLLRINNIRYKFNKNSGKWEEDGLVKDTPAIVKKAHNRGGLVGSAWMEAPVSFSQIYITNDEESQQKQKKNDPILVTSMHKYQPMITVKRVCDGYEEEFRLTMTEFMVVTAYQDLEIIKLKKEYNKYASGSKEKDAKKPQDKTARRGKRTNPSVTSPLSAVSPSFGTPATKMVPPPSWEQNYLQIPPMPTTPSGPPSNFQGYQMVTPPTMTMTSASMITPPLMGEIPPIPSSGGPSSSFQGHQMMTPSAMVMATSTMITPPTMGTTPPTPSSGDSSQNFPNPMWGMAPPAYDYPMQPDWNQYGAWNASQMTGRVAVPPQDGTYDMSQMAGGAPQPQWDMNQGVDSFQNFQQLGNPGNVPQNNFEYPPYYGAGTSSSSQLDSTDVDFRF